MIVVAGGWPLAKLVQQRLGLFQILRVEALGEPVVDRSEERARFLPLALALPQSREVGLSAATGVPRG
jgi:hypothetical protein